MKKVIKENEIKTKLTMSEELELVNNIVSLAIFPNGKFDCRYLEVGKLFYISASFLDEKFLEEFPQDDDDDGFDVLKVCDLITESVVGVKEKYTVAVDIEKIEKTRTVKVNLWEYLSRNVNVQRVLMLVDKRYEEVKVELLNKTNFEEEFIGAFNGLKDNITETIFELKEKLVSTMESVDLNKLETMAQSIPSDLSSMSDSNKDLLNKIIAMNGKQDKQNKQGK